MKPAFALLLAILLLCPALSAAEVAEACRVVALGDSVTKGVRGGVKPAQTFEAQLEDILRPRSPAVRVLNAGVGGNTVRHAWTRIYSDVIAKRPAFCTLMFGINDSYFDKGRDRPRISLKEYERRLRGFIRMLRYHAIEPVLMTANPMTSTVKASSREPFKSKSKGMNFMLEVYCDKVREIARAERLPLVDVYKLFWEKGGDEKGVDKLLTDGMHPSPAGHRLIAEALAGYLRNAMATRAKRPLPSARAAENMAKAKERLAVWKEWETLAAWQADVLPSQATPPWSAPRSHSQDMVRLEEGAMRFANLPVEKRRYLSFTRNLPKRGGAISFTYRARISAKSKGSPYFSLADNKTKVWTWMTPAAFVVSRHDRRQDRIEVPIKGEAFHTYRVILSDLDVYIFVDDMKTPDRIVPGWLAPGESGSYAQFALSWRGGPIETWWKNIEIKRVKQPAP